MAAMARALCMAVVFLRFTGDSRAADDGLSRVQIARLGKPATALVEVRGRDGMNYGSAFCIHASGLFVTNHHVTDGALGDIILVLNSGQKSQKSYPARVIRSDKQRDLALLQITGAQDLPALALGSDDNLEELMDVVAFGFPFGKMLAPGRQQYPAISVNPGSVTSLRRNRAGALSAIQLDVALNPGNSGGPVLDRNGKVVGVVVTVVLTRGGGRTGVNFAIPVNSLAAFLARPNVDFDPPSLVLDNAFKPLRFEARVVPTLPSKVPVTVDLILKSPPGPEHTQRMEAAGDNLYRTSAVPFVLPSGPLTLRLLAQFEDGLLCGTVSEQEFRVGGKPLKLTDVRSLQLGSRPRVLLQNGKTIKGAVSGLEAVPVRRGEQTQTVNLARASEVNCFPTPKGDVLSYTLLVRQGTREVFRQSGSRIIQGLLSAATAKGPALVQPPLLEGDTAIRPLPSEIADVAVGGAGRYLLLHLPGLHDLAIFDVSAATIIGHIPMNEDDGRFAAGLNTVIVVHPRAGTIERWNLNSLQREQSVPLPLKGVIKSIAMGSASRGPLLVFWAVGTRDLDRAFFSLIDTNTLHLLDREIKMPSSGTRMPQPPPMAGELRGGLGGGLGAGLPAVNRASGLFGASCYRDLIHIRASANGKMFGMWATSHSPSGLYTLMLSDADAQLYQANWDVGPVIPSSDGHAVYTAAGKCAPQVTLDNFRPPNEDSLLPACQGDYYLDLTQRKIYARGQDRPLAIPSSVDLPDPRINWARERPSFPVAGGSYVSYVWTEKRIQPNFTLDKRVHLIPAAKLIITIPVSNQRLVLHRLKLPTK